jgi:hypothetical protein
MQVIFFSLSRDLNHLKDLPIEQGAQYAVHYQYNKDLLQWELTLTK